MSYFQVSKVLNSFALWWQLMNVVTDCSSNGSDELKV